MAEKSFPLENTVYTAEDASLWFATRTSGVHASNQLGVTAADGLAVTVGTGVAWLKYAEFAGVSYANTEAKTLQLAAANANYPRIDRVVVRYSKAESKVYLAVKSGTAASNPAAPDVTRDSATYEISLAQILVKTAATSISASDITDERLNNTVCGLMSDGVTLYGADEMGGNAAEDSTHPGCYYRSNGGAIEWINPPMEKGVEYRTTDRYTGKVVYTALVDCGTVTPGSRIDIDTNFVGNTVVRYAGVSEVYALPFINTTLDDASTAWADVIVVSGKIRVRVKAGPAFGNRKAFVQVWYTREWIS